MSNRFEDYVDLPKVKNDLDELIDLVGSKPHRVFIMRDGEVAAVLMGRRDYEDLWKLELGRDMAVAREESARGDVVTHEEFMEYMNAREAELRARRK